MFTKLMIQHRQKELELKAKAGELRQSDESGKSLTESELAGLIREAVREETAVVLERISEVENRLNGLDDAEPQLRLEEESNTERKTLGRAPRVQS